MLLCRGNGKRETDVIRRPLSIAGRYERIGGKYGGIKFDFDSLSKKRRIKSYSAIGIIEYSFSNTSKAKDMQDASSLSASNSGSRRPGVVLPLWHPVTSNLPKLEHSLSLKSTKERPIQGSISMEVRGRGGA